MVGERPASSKLIAGAWFGAVALVGCAVALFGPSPSKLALVSQSEGLFITVGAIYGAALAIALVGSLVVGHWLLVGNDGIFELGPATSPARSHSHRFMAIGAYCVAALAICYFMFVRLGGTLICAMPQDVFVYYDGAERLVHHQTQHVDFHTPIGALSNVLPFLGMKASGGFAGSLEYGAFFAAAGLLLAGAYVLSTRYTAATAIPLVIFLCFLTVVPLNVESEPDLVSAAMFYNRLGWTSLTLAMLFFLEPRPGVTRRVWLDAICLASLLLFGFYLKVSYALVGFAFLPLIAWGSRYNLKVSVCTVGFVLAAMGGLELLFGFHRGYYEDLRMTLSATGSNRGTMAPKFAANIREYAMAAAAFALAIGSVRHKLPYFLAAGYIAAAGLAIIDQNTHVRGIICLLALFAISQELIRRSVAESPAESPARSVGIVKSLACLALIVMFMVQPTAYMGTAMMMIRSVLTQVKTDLPGGLSGMVFPDQLWGHLRELKIPGVRTFGEITDSARDPVGRESEQQYINSVQDGMALLAAIPSKGGQGQRVIAFDFVTPFPFVMGWEPPKGGHTCIHYGRTMSEGRYTPPEVLLGGVDVVMIPELPIDIATRDFLVKTYQPYLDEHFVQAAGSKSWTVWTRAEKAE